MEFFPSTRKNANKIQVEKITGGTTSGGIFTMKYVYFCLAYEKTYKAKQGKIPQGWNFLDNGNVYEI